jgi:hypothetical protein
LFEGEDDALDRTIMFLTGSKITHAALYCQEGVLADSGMSGVGLHALKEDPAGRKVHARRLDAPLSPRPVLDTAMAYAGESDPYDWPGLALLTFLVLYKDFTPSGPLQKVLVAFLKRVVLHLDGWIDGLIHQGKKPMVCSQFVAQCFQDASKTDARYRLEIVSGTFSLAAGVSKNSLVSQVAAHPHLHRMKAASPVAEDAEQAGKKDRDLISDLEAALRAEPATSENRLGEDLVEVVHALGDRLRIGHASKASDGVEFLRQQEPFFVTPADLYSRCTNLCGDMLLTVVRDGANWVPAGTSHAQ